jgi:hypothetical protein
MYAALDQGREVQLRIPITFFSFEALEPVQVCHFVTLAGTPATMVRI